MLFIRVATLKISLVCATVKVCVNACSRKGSNYKPSRKPEPLNTQITPGEHFF